MERHAMLPKGCRAGKVEVAGQPVEHVNTRVEDTPCADARLDPDGATTVNICLRPA